MHQNGGKWKREGLFLYYCAFPIFCRRLWTKDSREQPAIQETAEQTAKETHKAERENKQETVQENTPADEQEEAAAETGAATVLPMLVDYDYEAEYDQDSYETLISIDIPKIWL